MLLSLLKKRDVNLYSHLIPQSFPKNYCYNKSLLMLILYWSRWLACACTAALASSLHASTSCPAVNSSNASATTVTVLNVRSDTTQCTSGWAYNTVTVDADYGGMTSGLALLIGMPDDNPVASNQVVFYSYPKTTANYSTPPNVTCSTASQNSALNYKRVIVLNDGNSCLLTATYTDGGDGTQYVYTATLSRSGNIYSLSAGTVCGGVFGACAPPPAPPPPAAVKAPLPLWVALGGLVTLPLALFGIRRRQSRNKT